MTEQDLNVVFFGTPEFGEKILERLIQSGYKPVLVVTQPDQPAGRKQILTPPPIKSLITKHETWDIKLLQPEKLDSAFRFQLSGFKPDLFIVAAYGKIIPKAMLDIPKYGTLNVHPSLLPRWRGPSPIQYSILNDDTETGVTIMLMDEKIDHGPIVSSIEYRVSGKESAEKLSRKLAKMGADLLIETIPKWIEGKIKPIEQDHSQASYSKILTKDDGHIDWNKSAEEIERQIRAFTPWPGSFTFWDKKRLKIISASTSTLASPHGLSTGQTFIDEEGRLAVWAARGILHIEKLQPEGKEEILSRAFLNGHPQIIGALLR